MIVIFDANVWLSHLYANAPLRASALLYLSRRGAEVALPEVVRLEVEKNLRERLREFRDAAADNYEKLLKVFGTMKEAAFPSDEQIDSRVAGFFASTGFRFREVEFSLASARDSFLRTIDKRPPSQRYQQFKDGVIWADAIRLADEDEVLLVTADKAFFENGDPKKGIARVLAEEVKRTAHGVRLLYDVYEFVSAVKEAITLDPMEIISVAKAHKLWEDIERYCAEQGLRPLGEKVTYAAFATERANSIALACDLRVKCEDSRDEGKTDAEAFATFDCVRDETDGTYGQIAPGRVGVRFRDVSGELVERCTSYAYADGMVFGHRDVTHRFRAPLDA
jgi:hypothetical protein